MNLKSLVIVIGIVIALVVCAQGFAGLVDWGARDRYLKEQEEAAKEASQSLKINQNLPRWMQVEPTVKTDDEQKFDVNRDGVFQPNETKVYLRRAYQEIQDGTGKNVSNSEVLKEYDANKDGIISKLESEKIKKDAF